MRGRDVGVRLAIALALAVGWAAAQSTRPESRPLALGLLRPIENSAHQCARAGFVDEAEILIDVLRTLGWPDAELIKLIAECKKDAPKQKTPPAPIPAVATTLRTVARTLAKGLASLDPVTGARVAGEVLRLDPSLDEVHRYLHHVSGPHGWITPDFFGAWKRRGEIAAAVARARKLPVPLESSTSEDGFMSTIVGHPVSTVKSGLVAFLSPWSPDKLKRVVTETRRACALSTWLLTDDFKSDTDGVRNFLIFETEPAYAQAIDLAAKRGFIDAKGAEEAKKFSAFECAIPGIGFCDVMLAHTEADAESGLMFHIQGARHDVWFMAPCLEAGHLNWVCLTYLGTSLPGIAYEDSAEKVRRTRSGHGDDAERQKFLRLADAGVRGSRSWMSFLARKHEDPVWSRSMVDQIGRIRGDDRIKSTFVVEYLQEIGEFTFLVDKTKTGESRKDFARMEKFQDALKCSLGEFEERWRNWLLPPEIGVAERIDRKPVINKPVPEVITQLNDLRRKCFIGSICRDKSRDGGGTSAIEVAEGGSSVVLDEELSDGCRRHALYLGEHPAQCAKWPDAHEEWPDQTLFSPEGASAGLNSVIAPGAQTPRAALDGWLGTFYHRLPLLHPGLMQIGWGLEKSVAVLDAGSLTRPMSGSWHVVWPYDGMVDVPIGFSPELPNPVPGQDQSGFGYAVTLQVGVDPDLLKPAPEATVTLQEKDANGREIECWISAPSKPSNPDLKLPDAWCLIPKAPLTPKSSYHVTAVWTDGRRISWSFHTR